MRQGLYVSSQKPGVEVSVRNILMTSRRNNDTAGVTGLLYTDGKRFLQVLEGEALAVDETFARIKAEARHQAVVILSVRDVDKRQFGKWAMAHRLSTESADTFDAKLLVFLRDAPENIRQTFLGLVTTRQIA